jgi:hypothetical protein
MLSGRRALDGELAAESGREIMVLLLAGALAGFAHGMMLAGIVAAEGKLETEDPEYQQMWLVRSTTRAICCWA